MAKLVGYIVTPSQEGDSEMRIYRYYLKKTKLLVYCHDFNFLSYFLDIPT